MRPEVPEVSVKRKALSVVTLAIALFAAVVLQLTVVNRLPLPGAAAPDLVLLLVSAIAVVTTPAVAAFTGFASGLALDVAPPAAHYAGQNALVFCLVGYGASRVYRAITSTTGEHDRVTAFTVMAAATVAGEAGAVGLGLLLSDPDVTTAAVRHVLPSAILYDLLLSPFVFWLAARVTRGAVPDRAPPPEFSREQRLASVFRDASTGAAPNLRLAGTGMSFVPRSLPRRVPSLRLSGTGEKYLSQPAAGRVPKLRLSGTSARPLPGTTAAFSGSSRRNLYLPASRPVGLTGWHYQDNGGPVPLAARRTRKLNFAGDLPVRTGARPVRGPGKNWLRSTAPPALGGRTSPLHVPARGWLGSAGSGLAGGSGAVRPASRLADVRIGRRMGDVINGTAATGFKRRRRKPLHPRRFANVPLGAARSGGSSIGHQVPRSAAEALAARSAPSGLSALSGAGTPLAAGRRSPKAGWLRGSRSATRPAVARSPRSGWLGSSRSRPRTVIGSVVSGRTVISSGMGSTSRRRPRRRATPGGNWYTASPSGAWLRRGQHHWRKRSQRLLQLVGVGR